MMMRVLFGLCFVILGSLSTEDAWAGNGTQVAYAKVEFFTGEDGNSLSGSYGYSVGFQTYSSNQTFRWLTGASFVFSSAGIKLNSVNKSATLYGGAFRAGGAWSPFSNASIHSTLELTPQLGAKFLSIASPPAGIDQNGVGLSYGVSILAGVDFKISSNTTFRGFFEYIYRKAIDLGGQNPLDLNAFSLGIGYLF